LWQFKIRWIIKEKSLEAFIPSHIFLKKSSPFSHYLQKLKLSVTDIKDIFLQPVQTPIV